jgi:riboflavin transporter FmnP
MTSTKNPGRFAGLLYVLVSIPGIFALIYVPGKLIVDGNATVTANNIVAHEMLFRVGIACNLISQILFMWVALALYDLLKGVNRRHASLMLGLIVVSIPIVLLNELNAIAALILVRGADFLSIFEKAQRDALAMLFLNLHGYGFDIAAIFWGLWLFPLGLLVYRSGFIPRILGILLMLNCFTFPVNSFTSLLLPQCADIVSRWVKPFSFAELLFMFWLLIMGAKPKPLAGPASSAAVG